MGFISNKCSLKACELEEGSLKVLKKRSDKNFPSQNVPSNVFIISQECSEHFLRMLNGLLGSSLTKGGY